MNECEQRSLMWRVSIWTLAVAAGAVGLIIFTASAVEGATNLHLVFGMFLAGLSSVAVATLLVIRHMDRSVGNYRQGYQDGLSDGQTVRRVQSVT